MDFPSLGSTSLQKAFTHPPGRQIDSIQNVEKLKDFSIKPANSRYTLKMFGGPLTIEQFRQNFSNEKTVLRMIDYPMYISRDFVEEIDIQTIKNVNKKFFSIDNTNNTNNTNQIQKATERQNANNNLVLENTIDRFLH